MNSQRGGMMLALLLVLTTATEAMNYLALPRMGRSGYLAFPRMGRRGYLAFPRMGRGLPSGSDAGKDGAGCCLTGLKAEWEPQEGGTTTTNQICLADSCCAGLQEIMAQKPTGVFYSMCVPFPCPAAEEARKRDEASQTVLRKLNQLLRD